MRKKTQSEAVLKITVCGALALCAGFYGGQARAAIIRSPDANTLVLWHLEETTADQFGGSSPNIADFEDSSGNNHHGIGRDIAADQLVMGQPGVLGLATQHNGPAALPQPLGKRNFITRTGTITTEWTGTNSFTFEAWVKNPGSLSDADSSATTGTGRVIGMSRDSAVAWSLGIINTGQLRVFSNNGVPNPLDPPNNYPSLVLTSSALTWETDVWYYVALVSNDAATPDVSTAQWTVYRAKDGDIALGSPVINVEAKRSAPQNGFGVGGDTNTSDDGLNRAFRGFIDEAHFSKGARSESYLTGALVPEPSSSFLVGCAVIGFAAARRRRAGG